MNQHEMHTQLKRSVEDALSRFPSHLDTRLKKGLERLSVNSSHDFLTTRTINHLKKLTLSQYYLQKKMEESLQRTSTPQNLLFVRLFKTSSRICVGLTYLDTYRFRKEELLNTIQILLPGILEIPRSFYQWHHPEQPYLFCYLEIHKLRGKELSTRELKKLEKSLQQQLNATPPLTPALFWPFNEEESYRQVQLLHKAVRQKDEIPHVSIHFREQTPTSIEFLIHVARPKAAETFNNAFKSFPASLNYFCYFQRITKTPFPIEMGAFALKVPTKAFDVRDSINLLYARRYVMKYLESALGPCRDYNGGLFEKQQLHFEYLRVHLGDKIPLFDLFAEKVFYALHPVEKRLTISLDEAEELFISISDQILEIEPNHKTQSKNVSIIKAANCSDLLRPVLAKNPAHTQLSFGGYHYLCVLSGDQEQVNSLIKQKNHSDKTKCLRLVLEEGAPTSLNPYYSSGDMRCRMLCKLVFEGLYRLDKNNEPTPSGALSCEISAEGRIYTFKLRPHAWSNGERVTAVDYVTSFQRALRDHLSHPEIYFIIKNGQAFKDRKMKGRELGIKAIDSDTLQIELETQDPRFLHKLAQPFFFPLFGTMREPKWFNGPYLVSQQNSDNIILEKNPYYWDSKNLYFEEMEIYWNNDINSIFKMYRDGEVDWIGDPLSTLSHPMIQELDQEGLLRQQEVQRRINIFFNTRHPLLSSTNIRRALSLSIDRTLISHSINPFSIPLHPLVPSVEEANDYFDQGLAELGLTRETFPVMTLSYSHQSRREKLALCLKDSWESILGIKINLEQTDWNLFRNKLEKGLFEMSFSIQDTVNENTPEFFDRFEGSQSWNFSKWSNQHYRDLVQKAKKETDPILQKIHLADAAKILNHEVPFTPLFKYTHLFSHTPQLEGYRIDEEGCIDFSHSNYNQASKHVEI